MAEKENADTSMVSGSESSDSESGSSSEGEGVEWLVNNREKRSTAGQRLTALINEEVEDDELQLLFVEDDDDAGFNEGSDDGSDAQMSSSDDDDDQGFAAGAEELEGEKQLEQEEKAKAKRAALKRKANFGMSAAFKKRVKIDPTVPREAPSLPKKKSDRSSWMRGVDVPIRASDRGTTKQSKATLHEQLVGREIKKLRAEAHRAARGKVVSKAKELTQEDRLAEAARVEKKNAKSLNRWEEAEKIREEEQRAKLAALHNRKMEGPVITWWSGMVEFIDGKLRRVGKNVTIEEKKERKKKTDQLDLDAEDVKSESVGTPAAEEHEALVVDEPPPPTTLSLDGSAPLLGFTNSPPEPQQPTPSEPPRLVPSPDIPFTFAPIQPPPLVTIDAAPPAQQVLPAVTAPPVIEHSTRNSLILSNFNETAIKSKDTQLQILFGRKFPKQGKAPHPPLCAITHYPAKFIDPASGLPYRNAYAYKEIQKLRHGEYPWSSLLQAYVGQGAYAARGVPGRFILRDGGRGKEKGKGKE